MRGLLADVNVQGHLFYLQSLLEALDLYSLLVGEGLTLTTFPELDLDRHTNDRTLWNFCQAEGWVLLTENRNHDGPDSLQATMDDSWQVGHLPVLTLSNKGRFEHDRGYAERVASEIADILFGLATDGPREQSRLFLPK